MPQDWLALASLVFVLGMKHGFDADHLATIDGLTRYNARSNPALARLCGVLFSLGHGAVVLLIALLVSTLATHWQVPEWMEVFGAWISISFLLTLGAVNLRAVLRTDPTQLVQPVGFKGRFLGRLQHTAHPALIALVGALFAFSFDTMSQAALFALTATQYGGWEHALMLGLLFMLGMLLTDGINGFWISRLIRRADQTALIASRVMGLVVSGVSLLVAFFGIAKFVSPEVGTWSNGKELAFSLALVTIIALSFLLAVRLTRRPALV
jgi:nickel/cobalt transporter (NiCoT) family protein